MACWGDNEFGQMGEPTTSRRYEPETPTLAVGPIQQVAAGDHFLCQLVEGGPVWCRGGQRTWGCARPGRSEPCADELPYDHCGDDPLCFDVIEGVEHATRLASKRNRFCAVSGDGTARCWRYEQRHDGGRARWSRSPAVALPLAGVVDVAVASFFTCALLRSGEVRCSSDRGEPLPERSVHALGRARAIAAGDDFACALGADGKVGCFWFADGRLRGWPDGEPDSVAEMLGMRDVVKIAAGGQHACALDAQGRLGCWGANHKGQCGNDLPRTHERGWERTARPVLWGEMRSPSPITR
jgi:hypothetical protein